MVAVRCMVVLSRLAQLMSLLLGIVLGTYSIALQAVPTESYKWRDHDGKRYQLTVTFPLEALDRARDDHEQLSFFIRDTQGAVNQYSYRQLVQFFSRFQGPGATQPPVQIRLSPTGISARSKHRHLLKMFEQKAKQMQQQAYQYYFHVSCDQLGVPSDIQPCILLDYPTLISRYADDLQPLADRFAQLFNRYGIHDPRHQLSVIASFVQSLPYEMGESWFRNPLMVLLDGQGDCDERVLLTRILIDQLLPDLKTHLVILPLKDGTQHMLLMVGIEPKQGDRRMQIGEQTFVPIELTSLSPVGHVVGSEVRSSLAKHKAWAIWEP